MRWVALPVGVVILFYALLDVLRTLVMPRAARGRTRLGRILYRLLWRPWRWVGLRKKTAASRERVLSAAAPVFFFVQLVGWVSLALLGYALILWSPAFVHGLGRTDGSLADALYTGGSSLFTLGIGSAAASGWARAVVGPSAATRPRAFPVGVAYLPGPHQAFNRREV